MAKPLRPCVAAIIFYGKTDLVLMCERKDFPGSWQFPQGGIEEGESIERAFRREVFEEIGLTKVVVEKVLSPPLVYRFPSGVSFPIARKFSGQRQYFVVGRFSPKDKKPKVDNKEFRAYAWVPADLVSQFNIFKFKKKNYLKALKLAVQQCRA